MNSTQQLTEYIQTNTPCLFIKYGDGELFAAKYLDGGNCDGTPYTKNLGDKLREAFVYIYKQPNVMLGAWHDSSAVEFWNGLVEGAPVNWVHYHTVLIDSLDSTDKLLLFKAIKESSRKKIYIANPLLKKALPLLNIDTHVEVDYSNWFDTNYDAVFSSIKSAVENDSNTIILTSAGMGAKYLITDLHKLYPNAIYIDIGSGLDTICTKRDSRGYSPQYDALRNYLQSIIPENWESPEYMNIYNEARHRLGRHLG